MSAGGAHALERRWWWALTLGLAFIAGWEASGLDMAVTRLFGGPSGFAWRDHWLTARVVHDGGRLLALGVLLVVLADAFRRRTMPGPGRRAYLYWIAVVVLGWLVVPAFKRVSRTSCPWDLDEFGGHASYVPHWMLQAIDGGAGHCFPSGHACTGFAFLALAFLWADHHPRRSRVAITGALLAGGLFSVVQLMRGAHHLSHGLWAAWGCALLVALARRLAPASVVAASAGPSPVGIGNAPSTQPMTRIE